MNVGSVIPVPERFLWHNRGAFASVQRNRFSGQTGPQMPFGSSGGCGGNKPACADSRRRAADAKEQLIARWIPGGGNCRVWKKELEVRQKHCACCVSLRPCIRRASSRARCVARCRVGEGQEKRPSAQHRGPDPGHHVHVASESWGGQISLTVSPDSST